MRYNKYLGTYKMKFYEVLGGIKIPMCSITGLDDYIKQHFPCLEIPAYENAILLCGFPNDARPSINPASVYEVMSRENFGLYKDSTQIDIDDIYTYLRKGMKKSQIVYSISYSKEIYGMVFADSGIVSYNDKGIVSYIDYEEIEDVEYQKKGFVHDSYSYDLKLILKKDDDPVYLYVGEKNALPMYNFMLDLIDYINNELDGANVSEINASLITSNEIDENEFGVPLTLDDVDVNIDNASPTPLDIGGVVSAVKQLVKLHDTAILSDEELIEKLKKVLSE